MTAELQALLKDVRSLYEVVQSLRLDWATLQTIEQARRDYDTAVETARRDKEKSEAELNRLQAELRKRTSPPQRIETRRQRTIRKPTTPAANRRFTLPPAPAPKKPADAVSAARRELLAARISLKKMARRFAYAWDLDANTLGQINRIADDDERPLGEALALLKWDLYREPLSANETTAAHEKRLGQWQLALTDYQYQLQGEIETCKTQYRHYLGIWELWQARTEDDQGQQAWAQFLEQTLAGLQTEQQQLAHDIEEKRAELAALEARDD